MSTTKRIPAERSEETGRWLRTHRAIGTVHSVFSKSVNLLFGNEMLSILALPALLEPMSIRLSFPVDFTRLEIAAGDAARIDGETITIGVYPVSVDMRETWSETLRVTAPAAPEKIAEACALLRRKIRESGRTEGMAQVFDPDDASRKKLLYGQRVAALLAAETEPEKLAAFEGLTGLGIGLTPSGDDFLTGYMRTEQIFHPSEDFRPYVDAIAHLTNPISVKELRAAADGRMADEVNRLLFHLLDAGGRLTLAEKSADAVMCCGSTSGTDLLCGILVSLEKAGK